MDQSRRSSLPLEQFILTELQVAEAFLAAGEATTDQLRRDRCRSNARKVLDELYLFVGHSTDPHVVGHVRESATDLERRLAVLAKSSDPK